LLASAVPSVVLTGMVRFRPEASDSVAVTVTLPALSSTGLVAALSEYVGGSSLSVIVAVAMTVVAPGALSSRVNVSSASSSASSLVVT
jgi:hypothetical protein